MASFCVCAVLTMMRAQDVRVFGALKSAMKATLEDIVDESQEAALWDDALRGSWWKPSTAVLVAFKDAWAELVVSSSNLCQAAFKATGLLPFNPLATLKEVILRRGQTHEMFKGMLEAKLREKGVAFPLGSVTPAADAALDTCAVPLDGPGGRGAAEACAEGCGAAAACAGADAAAAATATRDTGRTSVLSEIEKLKGLVDNVPVYVGMFERFVPLAPEGFFSAAEVAVAEAMRQQAADPVSLHALTPLVRRVSRRPGRARSAARVRGRETAVVYVGNVLEQCRFRSKYGRMEEELKANRAFIVEALQTALDLRNPPKVLQSRMYANIFSDKGARVLATHAAACARVGIDCPKDVESLGKIALKFAAYEALREMENPEDDAIDLDSDDPGAPWNERAGAGAATSMDTALDS